MTDWRQIQARIRKAKNSPDAFTKLSELFQRTHDGMVAWELGAIEEKAARVSEAVKWYTVAAERFRRAEWKKKAEEALVRLGAPVPVPTGASQMDSSVPAEELSSSSASEQAVQETEATPLPLAYGEISDADPMSETSSQPPASSANVTVLVDPVRKKRRRGRRGGRGRRRKDAAPPSSLPTQAFAESHRVSTSRCGASQAAFRAAVVGASPRDLSAQRYGREARTAGFARAFSFSDGRGFASASF